MEHVTKPHSPTRAVLNFNHKCALNCEWCYVPFDGPRAKLNTVLAIVDLIAKLGFSTITFGGGDPFQYGFIKKVIGQAKTLGIFVHVDTHANSLCRSEKNLNFLLDAVDLLGLPLDGSKANVHDRMRSAPGHFDTILRVIGWLISYRSRLKINTVISAHNVEELPELAKLVKSIAPTRWSIYQYWPLGPAENVHFKHSLSDHIFAQMASCASELLSSTGTFVEINDRKSRRLTYPIIYHDGSTFLHDTAITNKFRYIGNIFDVSVQTTILSLCGSERKEAASRYARNPELTESGTNPSS